MILLISKETQNYPPPKEGISRCLILHSTKLELELQLCFQNKYSRIDGPSLLPCFVLVFKLKLEEEHTVMIIDCKSGMTNMLTHTFSQRDFFKLEKISTKSH
jgi:hypothetical protein